MKNLKSLKGNKFDMEKVKGGALPYDEMAPDVYMTASYTRPILESPDATIINDWFDASTNGDPGYSNVIDN